MKNIVIFGATGNLGVYFVDYCINHINKNEYNIIAVGRKKTVFFEKNNICYINVDITKEEDFSKLPLDVYAIVNLAGILPAYYSDFNPRQYVDVNIIGSLNILEYARRTKTDRVLYTQTWSDLAGYWGKEDVLRPYMPRKLKYTGDHAFYSITKSMVLDTMEFYHQEFGIKTFVFRLPNIYLYNPENYYYVDGVKKPISYRFIIEKAIKGEDIELWGNPESFKDVVYVKDFCQMLFLALFVQRSSGTYNVGTGVKTTFIEQIQQIIDVFSPQDKKSKIIFKPEKPSFVSFVMDIENAKEELGYEPKYLYRDYLLDYKKEREEKRFDEIWEK